MKKATVVCSMDPFRLGLPTPEKAEGYECSIAGYPMVVHKMPRLGEPHYTKRWTVTEPITGREIANSTSLKSAIRAAEEVVDDQGGPEAIAAAIEKNGPAPVLKQGDEEKGVPLAERSAV